MYMVNMYFIYSIHTFRTLFMAMNALLGRIVWAREIIVVARRIVSALLIWRNCCTQEWGRVNKKKALHALIVRLAEKRKDNCLFGFNVFNFDNYEH